MQIRNERKQEQKKEFQRNKTNIIEHKTIKADFLDTDATVSVF